MVSEECNVCPRFSTECEARIEVLTGLCTPVSSESELCFLCSFRFHLLWIRVASYLKKQTLEHACAVSICPFFLVFHPGICALRCKISGFCLFPISGSGFS